jgi:hypothetical protein
MGEVLAPAWGRVRGGGAERGGVSRSESLIHNLISPPDLHNPPLGGLGNRFLRGHHHARHQARVVIGHILYAKYSIAESHHWIPRHPQFYTCLLMAANYC